MCFTIEKLARREKSFAAFGQIPYLLDWVESIAEDVAKLRSDEYLDSQDVDNAIDEFIGDADLISQSDIESLIEFAIDEAKEEAQSIATDKISEIFEEKVLEIDWSVTPTFSNVPPFPKPATCGLFFCLVFRS
jgi:hypothetical protein